MKFLSNKELKLGKHLIIQDDKTRISVYCEHNCLNLIHHNILGSGKVWEVFKSDSLGYKSMVSQVKRLLKIRDGLKILSEYEVK